MLTGYSGAGKTTILTALGKRDDVSDEDVNIKNDGIYKVSHRIRDK